MNPICPWYQLGYIIPHRYTDLDAYQFYAVAPEGMMLVTTGLDLGEYTLESVEKQLPTFYSCLDLLTNKQVDRIALSGVPVAAALGRERTLRLLEESTKRTGLVCDTDLEAHIDTLKHLGISHIALATRWSQHVTQALIQYLKEAGITVLAFRSQGRSLSENKLANAQADHHLALKLGSEALLAAPDAQALPILETQFNKPVLLNILSTTSNALRAHRQTTDMSSFPKPNPHWGKVITSY